ncbi:MAG: hypothetical protein O7C65_09780 [Planctomycetota bacterium]|nr:hypothetical protein [Planctomycetota bacterium]
MRCEIAFPIGGTPLHTRLTNGLWIKRWSIGGSGWLESQGLPLRPIWPGFAINTLFYAAILWLPIRGPFALRRLIRRERGLCVVCGYDLRHADHDACPECGWRRETDASRPLP